MISPALNNAMRLGLGRSGGTQLKVLLESIEARLAALEGQSDPIQSDPPHSTDNEALNASMASDLSSPKRRGRPPKQ